MPGLGGLAARVEKWAGGSSSEVIFRSGTGSGGGWVRQGREEDAEGTCVGRGCVGRKEGPGGERG